MQALGSFLKSLVIKPKITEELLREKGIPMIDMSDLTIDKASVVTVVGSGKYVLGEYKNEQVSVKVVDITKDDSIINEFLLWKLYLNDDNFLQIKGVCLEFSQAYIVFENFQYTLETAIKNRILTFENKIKITRQCLEILQFFQSQNQNIKDFRPGVFALTKNMKVKLIDFGDLVTKGAVQNEEIIKEEKIRYTPLEHLEKEEEKQNDKIEDSTKSPLEEIEKSYDIYSFGCVLIDIFSLQNPILNSNMTYNEAKKTILDKKFPIIPKDINGIVSDIIKRCLLPFDTRITMEELSKNLSIFLENFSQNSENDLDNLVIESPSLNEHYLHFLKIKQEVSGIEEAINGKLTEEVQKMKTNITYQEEENIKKIKENYTSIIKMLESMEAADIKVISECREKIMSNILSMQNYFSDALKDMVSILNKTSEMNLSIFTVSKFDNQEEYTNLFQSIDNSKEYISNTIKTYSSETDFDKLNILFDKNKNSVELYENHSVFCSDTFINFFNNLQLVSNEKETKVNELLQSLVPQEDLSNTQEEEAPNTQENEDNSKENKFLQSIRSLYAKANQTLNKNSKAYFKPQDNSSNLLVYNYLTKGITTIQQDTFFNQKIASFYDSENKSIYISGGLVDMKAPSNAFYKIDFSFSNGEVVGSRVDLAPMSQPRYSHSMLLLSRNRDIIVVVGGVNTKSCEAYSIPMNIWKDLPDLPEIAPSPSICEYLDYIYVFNGENEQVYRVDIVSSEEIKWETVEYTKDNCRLRKGMGIGNGEGEIVLLGGFDSTNWYNEILSFSSGQTNDDFRLALKSAQLPSPSSFNSNSVKFDDNLILFDNINEIIEYNTNLNEVKFYI